MTGSWIDYDPSSPGCQHLSNATHPNVPPGFMMYPARDGSHHVLVAPTAAARVDLDLHSPSNIVATATPALPPGVLNTFCGLTPSGQFMLKRFHDPTVIPAYVEISLIQMSTGWETPWITFPPMPFFSSAAVAAWR
jgi:hypothetical protein